MHLTVSHTTRYSYDQPVDYALQQVRLTPQNTTQQEIISWDLSVEGGQIETSYRDHLGSVVHLVSSARDTRAIAITAGGEVMTTDTAGVYGKGQGAAPLWYFNRETPLTRAGEQIKALAKILEGTKDPLNTLHALSDAILEAAPYKTGRTYAETPAEAALVGGSGVCQDHAQIFIAAARAAGMPARYVSGYLMMNDRISQDASHAWAEVHLEGLGWIGFDVSNGISPDARYIRIAVGLDYKDAAPLSGLRRGDAKEQMVVSLQVQQ
ncbi:MAG: transglutaminase family protein [Pseudomonadota bacterium]